MTRHIVILQGHPDPHGHHLGHALTEAYAEGARATGHDVKSIEVAKLTFPLLHTAEDFYRGTPSADILSVQEAIRWADHLLIVYPLWLGHFPAVFHGFLEQTFRPDFAVESRDGGFPKKLLTGKSARIVVTMGMPALVYRWYFGSHSVKSLKRNILRFSGMNPVKTTLIGGVGPGVADTREPPHVERDFPTMTSARRRERWLTKLRALGRAGD